MSLPFSRSLVLLAVALLAAACGAAPPPSAPAPTGATTVPSAGASAAPSEPASAPASPGSPSAAASPAPSALLGPTDGGLTLVEPLREVASSWGSVTITPAGSLEALETGDDGRLHALACAAGCGNPATWSDTILDPGVAAVHPLIRARDDGSLIAAVNGPAADAADLAVGFCTAACDTAGSWHWTRPPLPSGSGIADSASRYLAAAGDAIIIGLGAPAMGALVCTSACQDAGHWTQVTFRPSACVNPSVAASPDGAMAYACIAQSTGPSTVNDTVVVWACPGQCGDTANWDGVAQLASGSALAADVTVGPGGMVGVAVNLGTQADASMTRRLGWFQCLGSCGQPASWHGIVVSNDLSLYAQRLAAVTDAQGRTVVAVNATSSAGNGLLAAACTADCLKPASWTIGLLDDATRVASQIPVPAPSGCDATLWVPDNVTDIALRSGWAAIASGYSSIGSGGACDSTATATANPVIRGVVSLAVVGP